MAKLTGKAKAEFLARMEKGRAKNGRKKKAKKANGKKKPATKKKRVKPAAKKKAAPKKKRPATKNSARKAAPKRPAKRTNGKKKSRRNSDGLDKAISGFQMFHGKQPGKIVEYDQAYKYPANYYELGRLEKLKIALDKANPDYPIWGFGDCQAVCTTDGDNIYFLGGNQAIDLDLMGITSDKDFVDLGTCTYIEYMTVKGFHDFAPTKYWHLFGEEDGTAPNLVYDQRNKLLFLTSGNYRVKPEGIVN